MDLSQFGMSFADIVEALCKRPQMYTMNGTFVEVTAYLEGYTTADPKNSRRELHGFNSWLSVKLGYPSHIVSWVYLREIYPDDAEALQSCLGFIGSMLNQHIKSSLTDLGRSPTTHSTGADLA
jgi:hypothetical protein